MFITRQSSELRAEWICGEADQAVMRSLPVSGVLFLPLLCQWQWTDSALTAFVLVSTTGQAYAVRVESTLRRVTIFAGLDDDALSLLMSRARQTTVPAGDVIVREGEPGNHLYLIVAGAVQICKRFDRPDQVELARLNAGDFFGEMCILETLPRAATVQAASET